MTPTIGSVWRKGDNFLHVDEVVDLVSEVFVRGSYFGVMRLGWELSLADWAAWSADAVCVYDPDVPSFARLPDSEIDRIAERLKRKLNEVAEMRIADVSELTQVYDWDAARAALYPTGIASVEPTP